MDSHANPMSCRFGMAPSSAVTFSFRNRIVLSAPLVSPQDLSSYVLSSGPGGELVQLLGPDVEQPVTGAIELRLRGSGYRTRDDAIDAGKLWRDRLTVAFAHYEKAIDMGPDDTPDAAELSGGQPYYIYDRGRVSRDTPKLTVFPTDNEPPASGPFFEGVVTHNIEQLVNGHLAWVAARDLNLTPDQRLAYKLLHVSTFEASPEARCILLFTGVEALIPERYRTDDYIAALEGLRAHLAKLEDVDDVVRETLRQRLEYQDSESIRFRGRTWTRDLLADRTFAGRGAEDYFKHAYTLRNKIAHGNVDRPSAAALSREIPELHRFLMTLLDLSVFGELMPGVLGFEPDGTQRPSDVD